MRMVIAFGEYRALRGQFSACGYGLEELLVMKTTSQYERLIGGSRVRDAAEQRSHLMEIGAWGTYEAS